MRKKQSKFIDRVTQPSCRLKKDAAEIEWDETHGSGDGDAMSNFRQQLRQGLQQAADECLNNSLSRDETDREHRQQLELMDIELRKILKHSPSANAAYTKDQIEFRRRQRKR
ncbi:hypothetical protein Q6D67_20870 [Haliea sp. E1-2-M8]|uniref:hypothetical protein n=1 Tax=Haliea sp. E1-2-M8 TaxID=3064706 RepID=UPI002724307B|nr:hypothetical protein [Haliea sp. E1-2-M8]MDO8864143.1 hypothetical protein [Haliea sp. E1-2-M8]